MRNLLMEPATLDDGPASGLQAFLADENGATAIEYGLIGSLIFLAIVAAVKSYTNTTSDMYSTISDNMASP
ncbi:MAG: Flp family type IVb pilin [Parvularculaceae bacterium]